MVVIAFCEKHHHKAGVYIPVGRGNVIVNIVTENLVIVHLPYLML